MAKLSQPFATRPRPVSAETSRLDALEAIKPIVARHGAEQLKRLVDLLG
jgi:hypothetical protein